MMLKISHVGKILKESRLIGSFQLWFRGSSKLFGWKKRLTHRILCTGLSIEQLLDVQFESGLGDFCNLKIENMVSVR